MSEATWVQVDPASLPEQAQELYADYVTKRRLAGAAKAVFEQHMNVVGELPAGKRLVFGYNFGKLSVAVVDDDRKPAKSAQPKLSLAEFMRQQAASGRAV
jgi:hypothetical protein